MTQSQMITPRKLALILAPLVAITPFAIDTYLPALPEMAQELDISLADMGQTISVYLIGFALGQLIGGPMSDRYGRHIMALSGLSVFIVCALAITRTSSLEWLSALRFMQALAGGFAGVVVAAIVRQHYSGTDSARVFSLIGMIMMIAPLIAPAVGAMILSFWPWRAIFWFLAIYATVMILLVLRFIAPAERFSRGQSPEVDHRESLASHIYQAYAAVLSRRRSFPSLLSQAFISGILFTYITNSSFIFMGYFDVSAQQFPIYFAALVGSSILSGQLNLKLLSHFTRLSILRTAVFIQFVLASILLALLSVGIDHLAIVTGIMIGVVGCTGLIYSNNFSMYLDYHGDSSGSASALFGCSTFAAGALLGSLSGLFDNGTLIPISTTFVISSAMGSALVWSIGSEFSNNDRRPSGSV